MKKIEELTPEQKADILPTFHKWRDEYSIQNDNAAAEKTIEQIYGRIDKKKPLVIFTKSPLAMHVLSIIWPDFIKRLNKRSKTNLNNERGAPLGDSLRESLRESLGASLGESLRESLRASLGESLGDSLGESLGDSLRDSLRESLGESLGDSLRESLGASLGESLGDSLGDSLGASLGDSLDVRYWFWYWAGFGIVDFILRHFGSKTDMNIQDAELWVSIGKNLSRFIPYENVCFVAEKPIRAVFNENNVLSYDHGAAQEYADGYAIYMLDGVRFEKDEWEKIVNQEFTLGELAKGYMGADKSAVAIKYLRPDRLLEQVKAELIHTGIKGTRLYKVENFMNTASTQYCMRMKHPSIDREYIEWVDPKVGEKKNADLAQCYAWQDEDGDPIPLEDYLNAVEA